MQLHGSVAGQSKLSVTYARRQPYVPPSNDSTPASKVGSTWQAAGKVIVLNNIFIVIDYLLSFMNLLLSFFMVNYFVLLISANNHVQKGTNNDNRVPVSYEELCH